MHTTAIVFKVTGSQEGLERWADRDAAFRDISAEEWLSEGPDDMLVCSGLAHNVPGDAVPHATLTEIIDLFPDLSFVGSVASPDGMPWLFEARPGQCPKLTVVEFDSLLLDEAAGRTG